MLFGPTLHASMIMSGSFGFDGSFTQTETTNAIFNYSHQFRMELFFMISGFFSSLVITRKGASHYTESRKKRIFRPTIISLFTILPLTALLMFTLQDHRDLQSYFSYRHIWFLVALSMISLVTFCNPQGFVNLAKKTSDFLKNKPYIFITAVFAGAYFISNVSFILSKKFLPREINVFFQISEAVLYVAPFFIGMILYFLSKLPSKGTIITYFLLFTLWYVASLTPTYDTLPGPIKVLLKDTFTIMVCLSIFYFFYSLKLPASKFISELSRIALPFYLFHLPILILLSSLYCKITENDSDIQYALIIIPLTVVVTYFLSWVSIKNTSVQRSLGIA